MNIVHNMMAISDDLYAKVVHEVEWHCHEIEMLASWDHSPLGKNARYNELCDLLNRYDEGERSVDLFVEMLEVVLAHVG